MGLSSGHSSVRPHVSAWARRLAWAAAGGAVRRHGRGCDATRSVRGLGCSEVASFAGRAWVVWREARPAAIVKLGCSQVASYERRARVVWREAKPSAIVKLGCNQVASYARKVRVVRREAKPAAMVKLGCSQAASYASRVRAVRREARPPAIVKLGCNGCILCGQSAGGMAQGEACGHS